MRLELGDIKQKGVLGVDRPDMGNFQKPLSSRYIDEAILSAGDILCRKFVIACAQIFKVSSRPFRNV